MSPVVGSVIPAGGNQPQILIRDTNAEGFVSCPFCGGLKLRIDHEKHRLYWVTCGHCHVFGPTGDSPLSARARWNIRDRGFGTGLQHLVPDAPFATLGNN